LNANAAGICPDNSPTMNMQKNGDQIVMTQEITMLLAVLLFLFVLTAIQVMMTMKQYGNINALSGRDDIPHQQPGLGGAVT
jgi:hypothetical protein